MGVKFELIEFEDSKEKANFEATAEGDDSIGGIPSNLKPLFNPKSKGSCLLSVFNCTGGEGFDLTSRLEKKNTQKQTKKVPLS